MPRNINVCGCRDRYKAPVSVTYRFGKDGKGNPTPQTVVLWRCRKCKAVRSQVVTGTWTLAEINGQPVDGRIVREAEEAAQQIITDQLATEALEMVAELPSASPTVARSADERGPVRLFDDLVTIGGRHSRLEPIQNVWGKLDEFSYRAARGAAPRPDGTPRAEDVIRRLRDEDSYPYPPVDQVYAINSLAERKAAQLPKRIPGSGPQYPIGDSPA